MLPAVQSKEGVYKQHHRACGTVNLVSVRNYQGFAVAGGLAPLPLVYILRRGIIMLRTIHFYFLDIKKNVLLLHSGSVVWIEACCSPFSQSLSPQNSLISYSFVL